MGCQGRGRAGLPPKQTNRRSGRGCKERILSSRLSGVLRREACPPPPTPRDADSLRREQPESRHAGAASLLGRFGAL